ncbi:MAG: sugar ABC transporter permease [Desulfurococcales archaeon]|nr:sugar ABC transporter permease [Desulfurococcales archaeon]
MSKSRVFSLHTSLSLRKILERRKSREALEALLLISVATGLNIVFGYFAAFFAFYLSFFKWDYISPMEFVGLRNYQIIFNDLWKGINGAYYFLAPFYTGLKNILLYTAIVVPTQTILAMILAAFANQKIRGVQFYKVSYFLPAVTSPVIIALIFIWLFMKNGFINYMIQMIVPSFAPDWINDRNYLLYAISMVAIWGTSGHFMVSFLAAMQSISRDVYEAAMLDGAGPIRRFIYITVPLLKPMIVYVVVLGMIGALQMFDLAWVMAGSNGGPGGAGYTMALDIYNEAFINLRPGVAAAKSMFLFVLIFTSTYIFQKKYKVMRQ